MSKLLNREIAEYIVEYDPEYSDEVYQLAGLKIVDIDGEEISEFNIGEDEFELVMFDYDKKFISLGIEYKEEEFKPLYNRKIYNDNKFPPTKPIKGGLWGSTYFENSVYRSAWEECINVKLSPSLFEHRLNQKSTLFSIKRNSRVLVLDKIEDVYIDFSEKEVKSVLVLRLLKVSGDIPKSFEKHFYVDFEKMGDYYDALYLTDNFVEQVDFILMEYDKRILLDEREWDEKITPYRLYVSEMLEDWNINSILIFNKECINVLGII